MLRFLCDGAVSGGGGVGEWSGEYQRTLFLNNDAQGGQREVSTGGVIQEAGPPLVVRWHVVVGVSCSYLCVVLWL